MNFRKKAVFLLTVVMIWLSGSFSLLNATVRYHHNVRANNAAGGSYTHSASVVVGANASIKPYAPSDLRVVASGTGVRVSWNDNSDNEDGFSVYYKDPDTGVWYHQNVGANTTSYTANNLKRGKLYPFVVFAFNSAGKTHASAKYIVVGE